MVVGKLGENEKKDLSLETNAASNLQPERNERSSFQHSDNFLAAQTAMIPNLVTN